MKPIPSRTLVLGLAFICLFAFLGSRGLNDPDEGRFAEVSREMALQESWLMPHLCGLPHLQKPPMIYWITASFIRLAGPVEWAVRMPSALAAFGTVWLTMHLAGLLFGRAVAWKSGLILVTSLLFFVLGRVIITDMLLTFWITAAVVSFVDYAITKRLSMLGIFYLSLGLGFLTKGPMAFFVPLVAVVPYAWRLGRSHPAKDLPKCWRWHWLPGLVAAVGLGLSWFILLALRQPELFNYFVKYEFIDRLASNTHSREKPFWFYSLYMFYGLLPWAVWLPRLLPSGFARLRKPLPPGAFLLLGWTMIPWILLHLVVSKLATYLLPLTPAMAILIALLWDRYKKSLHFETRLAAAGFAILSVAVPILHTLNPGILRLNSMGPLQIGLMLLLGLGWVGVFVRSPGASSNDAHLWRFALMMMIFNLVLVSQAEVIWPARRASKRPVADLVRQAMAQTGSDSVILLSGRHYSLDFYLQIPMRRQLGSVDLAMPVAPEMQERYIPDPLALVSEQVIPGTVLISSRREDEKILDEKPFWSRFSQSGKFSIWVPALSESPEDNP